MEKVYRVEYLDTCSYEVYYCKYVGRPDVPDRENAQTIVKEIKRRNVESQILGVYLRIL